MVYNGVNIIDKTFRLSWDDSRTFIFKKGCNEDYVRVFRVEKLGTDEFGEHYKKGVLTKFERGDWVLCNTLVDTFFG